MAYHSCVENAGDPSNCAACEEEYYLELYKRTYEEEELNRSGLEEPYTESHSIELEKKNDEEEDIPF